MRKGSKRHDWSIDDLQFLLTHAGKIPISELCETLDRTRRSIEAMVRRLSRSGYDISLRCKSDPLVWCSECARWRTYVNPKTGWCRVCSKREQLHHAEVACAKAVAMMKPEHRERYAKSESSRATRRLPTRPLKPASCPISMYERRHTEERWFRDIEEWEYRCLNLRYDAAKTRLRRMREKIGANPRKDKL